MNDLTPLQRLVLQVIRNNPGCQNSDAKLLDIYYHEIEGWDDTKSFYFNMSHSSPSGSITRARRRLHTLGYITYSKEADQRREKNYKKMLEQYGTHPTPEIVAPHKHGVAVSWLNT